MVGSGPAGGMAARQFAKAGHKTAILDMRKVVGVPVQCGEGMSRFALQNVGLPEKEEWISRRMRGARPICPGGGHFYAAEPGYSLFRDKFDQWVTYGAVGDGAEIFLNHRVTKVQKTDGHWSVTAWNGKSFDGRILIAADGFNSYVARQLGLVKKTAVIHAAEFKISMKDYEYDDDDWLSFYYHERYKGGYGWVFPQGDHYNVGVGGFGHCRELLPWFCAQIDCDRGKAFKTTGGAIPSEYELTHLALDGMMVVGDAGGFTNPVFGGGIHSGMWSGKQAGLVGIEALEKGDAGLCRRYETIARNSIFLDPRLWRSLDIMRHWRNEDFDMLGYLMDGKDNADLTLLKGFVKILRKRPGWFLRSRELLFLRKIMPIHQKYGW